MSAVIFIVKSAVDNMIIMYLWLKFAINKGVELKRLLK